MYQTILLISYAVGLIVSLALSWEIAERRLQQLLYNSFIQATPPSTTPVFRISGNSCAAILFLFRKFFAHHHRIPPADPLTASLIAQDCIHLAGNNLWYPVSFAWPFSAPISLFIFHSPDKFSKRSIRNTDGDSASSLILEAIGSEAGLPAAPTISACVKGFRVGHNEIGEKPKVFGIPTASMKSFETNPADRGSDRRLQGETAGH